MRLRQLGKCRLPVARFVHHSRCGGLIAVSLAPLSQVTALAFPNGRPTGTPDPKADPVTVTNSLNKKLEVIYDWGEQSVGQPFLGDSSLRTVRCVECSHSQPQSEALA